MAVGTSRIGKGGRGKNILLDQGQKEVTLLYERTETL
jgi:hypothetical protein